MLCVGISLKTEDGEGGSFFMQVKIVYALLPWQTLVFLVEPYHAIRGDNF
jgi:hypothetical protein